MSSTASTVVASSSEELSEIQSEIRPDLALVDQTIRRELRSDVELVCDLGEYIVGGGGKRLRPTVVLLAARACGYTGTRHIDLAAVIEFIHTATLLHDDVVDASELRRGHATANARWGNEASVLVGDFIYSRAFEMMVAVGDMAVMDIMSRTTNAIAEGEVLQLINCNNPEATETEYMDVILRKTARLFEAGAEIGAVISAADTAIHESMALYGRHLGIAYQLVDDVLDFSASTEEIGKNVGDDLAEGKPTLPLIYAMRQGDPEQRALIRKAIENGGRDQIEAVLAAIESTRAIEYTASMAQEHAGKAVAALQAIPDSPHRVALQHLAEFSVSRTY